MLHFSLMPRKPQGWREGMPWCVKPTPELDLRVRRRQEVPRGLSLLLVSDEFTPLHSHHNA